MIEFCFRKANVAPVMLGMAVVKRKTQGWLRAESFQSGRSGRSPPDVSGYFLIRNVFLSDTTSGSHIPRIRSFCKSCSFFTWRVFDRQCTLKRTAYFFSTSTLIFSLALVPLPNRFRLQFAKCSPYCKVLSK